jgi:RimJ/RimL family protein N-acetyltransferase
MLWAMRAPEDAAHLSMRSGRLSIDRLDLVPLTVDALDALILGDRQRLETLAGARFPAPLVAPPLMEDALPFLRDQLRAGRGELGWGPWLAVVRATGDAVGCVAVGRPDAAGRVMLGYSIYPGFEGRGYATEAARALVSWALIQANVSSVRATIPPWHAPSVRVAEKIGMHRVGTDEDDEVGEVLVFELRRLEAHAPRR